MLTSRDLKLIEDLFIKFEEKISTKFDYKLDSLESRLTKKIDDRADQIIEYINPSIENHEKRITKLEDKPTYFVRDQNKE